jgi:hypothetical protein
MYIELTGTGGLNTNLLVPANKKLYFIFNNSTGAVTVKVTGLTGISVPATRKMVLVCNGTDIVDALTYFSSLNTGAFSATSVTCSGALVGTILSLTGSTLSGSGLNLPSANTLGFVSNSVQRGTVNSTGNWSYVAASAGITATFNSATNTHSVQIGDSANTKYNAGFLETPVNATTAVTITPVLADSGKTFYFTGSSAPTATIPANGSVAYPVGTVLTFVNDASAAVSMNITITTDTLQLAGTGSTTLPKVLARYGVATAVKVASTKWVISGNGLT